MRARPRARRQHPTQRDDGHERRRVSMGEHHPSDRSQSAGGWHSHHHTKRAGLSPAVRSQPRRATISSASLTIRGSPCHARPSSSVIAMVAGVSLASARQSSPPRFRAGTHTVSIYATVLDQSGRLVPNLGAGRLRRLRQRRASADDDLRQRSPAHHHRHHAGPQRQHDGELRPRAKRRRAVRLEPAR